MPLKSKRQQRLMYAAASGKSNLVPTKVAQEFIAATPDKAYSKLKETFRKKKK